MNESIAPELGLLHLITQSDGVGHSLFVILVLMSVASWSVVVWKALKGNAQRETIAPQVIQALHQRPPPLEEREALLNSLLDQAAHDLEKGMTVLATVASSAPFVGLFGTVWGIYHALMRIAQTGQSSLDQVAGPVGESLIMTALGLAVAIPAAVAFNLYQRQIRSALSQSELKVRLALHRSGVE